MKYSQLAGIVACLSLLGICYLPWIYIPTVQVTLSGVQGHVTADLYYGKPFLLFSILSIVMILFFALPKIWAKRTNIYIGLIVLGYAIYNFLLFSMCREGVCPEKKTGLYLMPLAAVIIQVMTFLPKINVPKK